MRDVLVRQLLLIVLLGLLVACVKVVVGWWKGEMVLTEEGNWFWLALFPILLGIWFRYFSIFGCKAPACLLPKEGER